MRRQSFVGALVTFGLFTTPVPGSSATEPPTVPGVPGAVSAAAQESPGHDRARRSSADFLRVTSSGAFSPNGDGTKDRGRFTVTLTRRATVTVKVTTASGQRLVRRDKLGRLRAGSHRWFWDGRNDDGRRVADRRYVITVRGRASLNGATATSRPSVRVDTVYRPGRLEVSDRTVYPNTAVTTDRIWFGSSPADDADLIKEGTLSISTPSNKVKYSVTSRLWDDATAYTPRLLPVGWDGRDSDGQVVKPGRYSVRLYGTDAAGNSGASTEDFTVFVSAAPLVEASGTQTVTPAPTLLPLPDFCTGPHPPNGCGDAIPCGTVAPSTAYTDPEALSYRSTVCDTSPTLPLRNYAIGYHALVPDVSAPRGITAARVAMRGKPTTTGETDTAQLLVFGSTTTSPAITGESLTTSPFATYNTWHPSFISPAVEWLVSTFGTDSYDVAGFTVEYTYLTPQS